MTPSSLANHPFSVFPQEIQKILLKRQKWLNFNTKKTIQRKGRTEVESVRENSESDSVEFPRRMDSDSGDLQSVSPASAFDSISKRRGESGEREGESFEQNFGDNLEFFANENEAFLPKDDSGDIFYSALVGDKEPDLTRDDIISLSLILDYFSFFPCFFRFKNKNSALERLIPASGEETSLDCFWKSIASTQRELSRVFAEILSFCFTNSPHNLPT